MSKLDKVWSEGLSSDDADVRAITTLIEFVGTALMIAMLIIVWLFN